MNKSLSFVITVNQVMHSYILCQMVSPLSLSLQLQGLDPVEDLLHHLVPAHGASNLDLDGVPLILLNRLHQKGEMLENTFSPPRDDRKTHVHHVGCGLVPRVPCQDPLPPLLHGHGEGHNHELVAKYLPEDCVKN